MALLDWVVRCLPGLSILGVLIVSETALQVVQTAVIGLSYPPGLIPSRNPVFAQTLFCAYSLLLHILAFLFPLRLCRAVWQATNAIKEARNARPGGSCPGKVKLEEDALDFSQVSSSSQQQDKEATSNDTINAIMVPSYKEDIGVLEDTLNVLASHALAHQTYDVRTSSTQSHWLTLLT